MIGYAIVTAIWGVLFFAQSIMHNKERQNLYNRLMSRDLGEYLAISTPKTKLPLNGNYFKKSMSRSYHAMYGKNEAE